MAPLDLDAIEARARAATGPWLCMAGEPLSSRQIYEHVGGMDPVTTLALVAEVRLLREDLSKAHFVMGTHAMRAIGVEPPS